MHDDTSHPAPYAPSGRPGPGEYASYAEEDFSHIVGDDAVAVLAAVGAETLGLVDALDEAAIAGLAYAPGKWTVKEVLGHLADDERIYAYRALAVARGDTVDLPGFDENRYVETAGFEARALASLRAELAAVRQASLTLFAGFPAEAWLRRGTLMGYHPTPRGLAFHIAAHELHHLRVLRQRYLSLLRG
ncbi:MAG: DinB family protein [Thermoanaerobaculia bacterium]